MFLDGEKLKGAVVKGATQRLSQCALMVEAEAKRLLSKGGKNAPDTDLQGKQKTTYTPAEPGVPPHLRTGNLRASIKTEKTQAGSYLVGPATTAPYGRIHEFGGHIVVTAKMHWFLGFTMGLWKKVGSMVNIPARPFMKPALDNCIKKFPALFKDLPMGGSVQ